MFCPRCGTKNVDDSKFCRSCGADIHLVPQALSLQLPDNASAVIEVEEQEEEGKKERKYKFKEQPTLEKGLENSFIGIAFLIIFLLGLFYYRGGFTLWVWLLIPSLACLGDGLGQIIRSRQHPGTKPSGADFRPQSLNLPQSRANLPAADTSEIISAQHASITEGTTRNLTVSAERK
jgi:hypothetical protein